MTMITDSNSIGQIRDLTAGDLDLVSGGTGKEVSFSFGSVDFTFLSGKNADVLVAKGTHNNVAIAIAPK